MKTESKVLNRFDLTMIMVSFVIGMGIFRTPSDVAAHAQSPVAFYLIWLLGGIVALCGALTYAEIGSRIPATGAYYRIFSIAYHPSLAFGVNCIILIANAANLAGVALIGAEYFTGAMSGLGIVNQSLRIPTAIGAILLFYFLNLAGLKMSSRTQNVLSLVKIGLVLLLILPLFFPASHTGSTHVMAGDGSFADYLKAFGLGLVAVSFTYGGYQQTINFGAEVKNPAKTIPASIFSGIALILCLYLIINYAYIQVIGFDQLKQSSNIAALMAEHVFGEKAARVLSVLLFLSVLGYVNGSLMNNPRVMQAMGEEKALPALFARRTEKNNVLFLSLTTFAMLSVIVVFWAETFDRILSFSIFLDSLGMVLSAATIFIFRRKQGKSHVETAFRLKWYPLLPLIFIAAYAFVAGSIAFHSPFTALLGLGILFLLILGYFLFRKLWGG